MGLSIRGLTRGVMGGITAYRRGALAGNEQNREIAAAEAARQRQKTQDEQAALYREVESNLASRQQLLREKEYAGGEALRAADVAETNARAEWRKTPQLKTRLIATAGGQEIVADVPGKEFGPRPRGVGDGRTGRSPNDVRIAQLDHEIDDARGAIDTARGGLSPQAARHGIAYTPADSTTIPEIETLGTTLRSLTAEREALRTGTGPAPRTVTPTTLTPAERARRRRALGL